MRMNMADVVISTYSPSAAVRVTHEPTGTVVTCDKHSSEFRNREEALKQLREQVEALELWAQEKESGIEWK